MYDVDIYTWNGAIIHNQCRTLDDALDIIRNMISDVQLINIMMT